jgi:hypothetical protein
MKCVAIGSLTAGGSSCGSTCRSSWGLVEASVEAPVEAPRVLLGALGAWFLGAYGSL